MSVIRRPTRVVSYATTWTKEMEEEYRRRTVRAAEVVRQLVRQNISKSGGGRPSKPGEYPRKQSGALLRGVKTRSGKRSPFTFRVYSTAPYSDIVEYGHKGGKIIVPRRAAALSWKQWMGKRKQRVFALRVIQGKMAPRSFLKRTLIENRAKIKAIYVRGIKDKKSNRLRIL